jgi:hypothetical protein
MQLNPVESVMVKNEHYMEKFSQVFDYSLEMHYESPVICSQVLAFGSNNVDFFRDPVYDHGVETLLYGTMHTTETRYDLMHGYRKNIAKDEKCNLKVPGDSNEQDRTAGIVEIVNAEDVAITIDGDITKILKEVAEKHGFTLMNDPVYDEYVGFVIMKEGYIAARNYPDDKYIGFDINLWGNTYKIDSVKKDLVKAVGSSNISSYKVVVGGMYGSNTWKEDKKIIGPKPKQLRNCREDIVTEGSLNAKFANQVAFEEVVPLTLAKDITALVVCGKKGEECTGLTVLEKHNNVKQVIPIYQCPDLGFDVEKTYACEVKVVDDLKKSLGNAGRLHLIVMDEAASYEMFQIMNSVLSKEAHLTDLLHRHSIAAIWSSDTTEEQWRREFLDRFRKQVEHDPVSRAEIWFQAGGKAYELGLVSTKNPKANYEYEKLESRLKERLSDSKAHIELRKIHGGLYNFNPHFKANAFRHEDYDSKPGRQQFAGQVPLGRQNIFQLVKADEVKEDLGLSLPTIYDFLAHAMRSVFTMPPSTTRQYYDVGDGGVILALLPIGSIIIVWDGREHIDINLFQDEEWRGLPEKFMGAFLHATERRMKVALRDDQPRGTGRVINFPSDIADLEEGQ